MKRKLINLCVIVLVLIGVTLLVYPYASYRLSERDQSYVVQQYDDSLAKMIAKQMEDEWERAQMYNASLVTNVLYDPFASGQDDMDEEYLSILNLDGNGVMCHISIPKINVDLPVFHGVSASTLEKGVGHLEGSSLPVGGAGTHTILTAHTGINSAKLFTDLTELLIGDEFYIYTLDQILAYRVDNILIVEPENVEALEPAWGKDYATLVTCTPYGINSHRLLVRGERVDYTPEEIEDRIADIDTVTSKETYMLYAGIALLVLLVIVILITGRVKNWRVKQNNIISRAKAELWGHTHAPKLEPLNKRVRKP